MASPRSLSLLLAGFSCIAICKAGPLGPLPNITSSQVDYKNGSCAVGSAVYAAGAAVPGDGPCERCACAAGSVSCSRTRCEVRAGCKALHRPDQCCATYQCECEQDGRTYGNGEKLVDPQDPCRVCYCQGGEVVCRRIACFRRDDCLPRLVPGRCCPEYDNCPLRGVTAISGAVTTTSSVSSMGDLEPSALPPVPKENIKQEITIKEITPVSEIPVITDVKIKEILPSPSIDVAEYSSSKSPLIPREATSEKISNSQLELTEQPVITEIHSSSSFVASSSPEITASSSEISETKGTRDLTPSKISFSTQDSINSDIYPSNEPSIGTVESHSIVEEVIPVATTMKPSIVLEEEDLNMFDHNPAFPPIPDDLSLVSNHQDEISSDPNIDGEHISSSQDAVSVVSTSTESPVVTESHITIVKDVTEDSHTSSVTPSTHTRTVTPSTPKVTSEATTEVEESKTSSSSPMLNLRSAIPTEILNVPSYMPEDITGELDDINETSTNSAQTSSVTATEIKSETEEKVSNDKTTSSTSEKTFTSIHPIIPGIRIMEVTTTGNSILSSTRVTDEQSTTFIAKSNAATEITAQTEFSSLPIETSDQNPHEESIKEKLSTSSAEPTVVEVIPTNLSPIEPEIITFSRDSPINTESHSFENVETTEFVLTSFGSSETATDAVEVIKISPEVGKSGAIIESTEGKKQNVFADLINLVGDVASIKDHTDRSAGNQHVTNAPTISDSEELILVNAGYKSKNSNWNLNSITEIPKIKYAVPVNKQKVIEIEDEESDNLTDSPPPNDKVEPTTRRPIIDNVSDDQQVNKTNKTDIEIISQTYVPTVDRRPTKVVMKKNNEKPISEESSTDESLISALSEATTDGEVSASNIQADVITIERRPTKVIVKEISEKPVAKETTNDEGGLVTVSSETISDGKVFTSSEVTTAVAVETTTLETGSIEDSTSTTSSSTSQ